MTSKQVSNNVKAETLRKRPPSVAKPDFQEVSPAACYELLNHSPESITPSDILRLQRLVGNQAVSGLLQAKLIVGAAGDKYEREADRIADQVMSGKQQPSKTPLQREEDEEELQTKPLAASITPLVQRQEEKEELQARGSRSSGQAFDAGSSVENRLAGERGRGSPLPGDVREFMEDRFGANFSAVRIHDNQVAAQLNRDLGAQAFTHGTDVYMGEGKYNPGSQAGKHLLAHELTHVIQQTGGGERLQRAGGLESALRERLKQRRQAIAPEEDEDDKQPSFLEQRREVRKKELQQLSQMKSVSSQVDPPTLTIMSLADFKRQSSVSWKRRGKTMRAIDEALGAYHAYLEKVGGKLTHNNCGQARAYLEDILLACNSWLEDHAEDTSRSKKRMPAVSALKGQADTQLGAINTSLGVKLRGLFGRGPQEDVQHTKGSQKIRQRMQGSVSSILGRLAPVIDMAAPVNNSSCEIDVEVKIPVDPDGIGFLGGHLNLSAERDEESRVEVRVELSITGGANIPGFAEIKGEVGGYIEAKANTAEQTMILVSYGYYRRFRESKFLPRGWANFIWGGSQSQVGYKRSERWAAKVEKDIFGGAGGEEASVEIGGLAAVSGEGKVANVAKVGGGLKYTTGRKYTKETVEKAKGKIGKQLGQALDVPTRRGAQINMGQGTHAIEIEAEAEAGPFSGSVGWSISFARDVASANRALAFDSWELSISAGGSVPVNEALMGGFLGFFSQLAIKGIEIARSKLDVTKMNKSTSVGAIESGVEDVTYAVGQLSGLKDFALDFSLEDSPSLLSGSVGLNVSLTATKEAGKPLEVTITINYEKGGSLDMEAVSGSLKKSRRLVGLKWEGSWKPTII